MRRSTVLSLPLQLVFPHFGEWFLDKHQLTALLAWRGMGHRYLREIDCSRHISL